MYCTGTCKIRYCMARIKDGRGPVNNPSQQMLSRPESALSAESVLSTGYSIMTVNSNIVLPRICMKYQNMLTEILAGGGCLGRGLSTDRKFTYSSMHARRIQCMRSRLNRAVTTSQLSQHILVFHAYAR